MPAWAGANAAACDAGLRFRIRWLAVHTWSERCGWRRRGDLRDGRAGSVKRVGRCDSYATEFDLEVEEYVPLPKGDVHKKKAIVQVGADPTPACCTSVRLRQRSHHPRAGVLGHPAPRPGRTPDSFETALKKDEKHKRPWIPQKCPGQDPHRTVDLSASLGGRTTRLLQLSACAFQMHGAHDPGVSALTVCHRRHQSRNRRRPAGGIAADAAAVELFLAPLCCASWVGRGGATGCDAARPGRR